MLQFKIPFREWYAETSLSDGFEQAIGMISQNTPIARPVMRDAILGLEYSLNEGM